MLNQESMFRLIACGLIAWTAFLIVRKILRKIGVVSYPPFKSRREYLAAALEMDIDEFLERARVTPRHVIEKSREMPPTPPPTSVSSPAGANGICFTEGAWVRIKREDSVLKGDLAKALRVTPDKVYCNVLWGGVSYPPQDLELAVPRKGEWWEKRPCALTHCRPGVSFVNGLQQWKNGSVLDEELSAVACGCLAPVNFGKGEDKKSGVA